MIDYVTLGTNDPRRAKAFYDAVLATLGHAAWADSGDWIGYGAGGQKVAPVLWICRPYDAQRAGVGNGTMVSFTARNRAQVHAFHAAALAAGGTDEGAPGLRKYAPNWYGAYVRDLDGNKLCCVCRQPE